MIPSCPDFTNFAEKKAKKKKKKKERLLVALLVSSTGFAFPVDSSRTRSIKNSSRNSLPKDNANYVLEKLLTLNVLLATYD